MTRRRSRIVEADLANKIEFYRQERQIAAKSPAWAFITAWQRQGLVRLRWEDTGKWCNVSLTEAGDAALTKDERLPNVF